MFFFSTNSGLSNIHNAIDWRRSIVGGSFALHRFTQATSWQPNDMDIMVAASDRDDFNEVARRFEKLSKCEKIKEYRHGIDAANIDDEDFDESLMGTKTYQCPGFDKNVQLVAFDSGRKTSGNTVRAMYETTSDLPSCVSYQMIKGKIHYNVPEKGLQILRTMRGSLSDIRHKDRLAKYEARGYTFE